MFWPTAFDTFSFVFFPYVYLKANDLTGILLLPLKPSKLKGRKNPISGWVFGTGGKVVGGTHMFHVRVFQCSAVGRYDTENQGQSWAAEAAHW